MTSDGARMETALHRQGQAKQTKNINLPISSHYSNKSQMVYERATERRKNQGATARREIKTFKFDANDDLSIAMRSTGEFPFSSPSRGYYLIENIRDSDFPMHVTIKNHKKGNGGFFKDVIGVLKEQPNITLELK